ncbi:hypothetical protein ERO13_D13G161700v2 [Gossypium hirsutum]|uniref:Uncharacterized protein isoform X2 n=5 Tax=Gossypium TaxID=3633 RepID=A0ABM3BDG2_GOSHI|nr:uncharacterized protein LOC105783471 isoform X2 [Gossypium raimondii]XP_040965084.1 uncharacterized protein LOC121225137 isoform X2 [Gossypium hirsutum]TYG38119.1 hypothetical protein ES288_D13G196100v1 [Gossypium darwinii]TYH35510.1 hypothetical protein ES332_D13G197800v1 [Gossypium tomentosum]TYI47643.1 hypothetical protein E1A91_D13G188600v1 [Gossypium mustelinum]KAG4112425.1 hypothetical protein ERO13_D13G161700v2 [Gossypium hirsutum]KJB82237.1 hypothetical protein B456_013G183700 [Gos
MALSSASVFTHPLAISTLTRRPLGVSLRYHRLHHHRSPTFATLSSSSQPPSSTAVTPPPTSASENTLLSQTHQHPNPGSFNYALANPKGDSLLGIARSTESNIEKGCVYIFEAYKVYWTGCVKGIHTGNMVLRLVEAIDVYLAGTVMLIFGMGLYGLFISNLNPELPADVDRALKGSSLFGMFAMKERPKWMKISSLDELKTKVGHVIVMILLVKMFERSKMVAINTGMDLLSYAICIFLSSASLYILHHLHKPE